jgi:uncharacterized protein
VNLNEVDYDSAPPFDGYGPGFFRVAGTVHEGPVLLTSTGIRSWDGLHAIAPLAALAGEVDFILLGMGAEIAHPPAELRDACEAAGLGLEIMSSPAACRTYNVLLGEGRRVAAAVVPLPLRAAP